MREETSWKLYTDNPSVWIDMLHECERATTSIDLENFIFSDDEIGSQFIGVCAQKAREGVRVRFIWDAAGSFTILSPGIVENLKEKGIELVFFKTLLPSIFKWYDYRSWYFRNHRRALIVDKKVAFTGSYSISKHMENWRDTSVRIVGPVVLGMHTAFEQIWERAHGKRARKLLKMPQRKGTSEFEYITNSPFLRQRYLYKKIVKAIQKAETSVTITVPYFIPTHRLARALVRAAKKGVRVHIMLPENSDFPTVDLGARTFFHSMLKAGIRIHLYRGHMIHAKTILIDDTWASMGTLNFDQIGLLHNFEANLVTTNKKFIQELKGHFEHDLGHTREMSLSEWNERFFVEKIATFFVKLIRRFL